MQSDLIEKELLQLAKGIEKEDSVAVKKMVIALLEKGLRPGKILEEGLVVGMKSVLKKFETLEAFLPNLILASQAFQIGVEVLKPSFSEQEKNQFRKGTVVIGTVKGDIHDVGKTIVASMLTAAGFEVYDLGVDVPSETFLSRALEVSADIIAVSCLMTTTMQKQGEVIEDLERLRLRDRFKVLVGGGPVTDHWAKQIGADGYGEDGIEAIDVAIRLVSSGGKKVG